MCFFIFSDSFCWQSTQFMVCCNPARYLNNNNNKKNNDNNSMCLHLKYTDFDVILS